MERGFIYTGSLRNNRRYGQGRMITPKGTIYEGEWLGNQIIEGTMLTDKSEYDGQFKNLSPDGYGTMRYKNGSYEYVIFYNVTENKFNEYPTNENSEYIFVLYDTDNCVMAIIQQKSN
jgi:hypothetical protein